MKKILFLSLSIYCLVVATNCFAQSPCLLNATGSPYSAGTTTTTTSTYPILSDLNNDGKPDIVSVNPNVTTANNNVSVFLNNGSGSFGTATHYTVSAFIIAAFVSDLNGDGFNDIAAYNNYSQTGGGTAVVLLNQGNGTFSVSATYTAIASSTPYNPVIKMADLNGDTKPDFVGTTIQGTVTCVSLNNGDGTFALTPTSYTVGDTPTDLSLTDVNGDNAIDMLVLNQNADNIYVFINNGNGTFASPAMYPTANAQTAMRLADLNGDSKPDIIVTSPFSTTSCYVLLNNGSGGFPTRTSLSVNSNFILSDVNLDAKPDFVSYASGIIKVTLNSGSGTFTTTTNYTLTASPKLVQDVNSDSYPDIICSTPTGVSILFNNGNSTFASSAVNYNLGITYGNIYNADMLSNGYQDLIVTIFNSNRVTLLVNDGTGGFAAPIVYPINLNPDAVYIQDLNADTRPDLVIQNNGYNETVLLNNIADNVSGLVTQSNSNPVTAGSVYIFKPQTVHPGLFDTVGSTSINTNGTYNFHNLPYGSYFIEAKAAPSYSNAVSTYYSNKTNNYRWDSAVFLNHIGCSNTNYSGYNITVLEIPVQTGTCVVSGNVSTLPSYGHRLASGGNNSVFGVPIKGVDIKLGKNPAGGCANRTTTDNAGNYSFTNVDTGSYFVFVDIPNFIDTIANIHVTSNNNSFTNVNYCVDSVKVHFCGSLPEGITKLNPQNSTVKIYPNPAQNNFTIETNSTTKQTISMFDINGKLVLTQTINTKTSIDISNLNAGVYNITITNAEGITNKRLVIIR